MPPWMQRLLAEVADRSVDSLRGSLYALGRLAQGDSNYYANSMAHAKMLRELRKEQEYLRNRALASKNELRRFIEGKQREWDEVVTRERAKGNNIPVASMLREGEFMGYRALVRYQMNGRVGQMDIFYGGAGDNPLQTPIDDYHGHIIVLDGAVQEWLLPGPRDKRERISG